MRQQSLSAVKAGITRLRDKGGASPDSLFDLLNGYVTAARTIRSRGGSRIEYEVPDGTIGLMAYKGEFWVFANESMPAPGEGYRVEVLRHPTDTGARLRDIHFAVPFLGYPYVVAEFDNGDVFHYWLEEGEVWQPGKTYLPGALVRPANANGLAYRLESDTSGYVPWAPNVGRSVGDVVVPTVDNGFKYTVTETNGSAARSGMTEPNWPTTDGEAIYEDANVDDALSSNTTTTAPAVPASVSDRYGKGNR